MERDKSLDVAKGFGILLVVIGHGYSGLTNMEQLICGFHMPFFFIVTGILYGKKGNCFQFKWKKKIKELIVPYVIWEGMWCLVLSILNLRNADWSVREFLIKTITLKGNIATWYLPCLFLAEALFFFLSNLKSNIKYILIIVCFAIGLLLPESFNNMGLLFLRPLVGLGFLSLGYYGKSLFQKKCSKTCYILILSIYIVVTLNNGLILFYIRKFNNIVLFLGASVIGSYLSLVLCKYITDKSVIAAISSKLSYWGKNSLTIMCSHMFVIELIRLFDYKFFGEIFTKLGELEGIILAIPIMLVCEIIIPIINRYFAFFVGRKNRCVIKGR